MTTFEKTELALTAGVVLILPFFAAIFPRNVTIWRLIFQLSILVFIQSLIRDLWLLFKSRNSISQHPKTFARCMCVETTVGITGFIVAFGLLWVGAPKSIAMSGWN